MKHCRYCNNPQPQTKAHLDVCHRGPCKVAHRKWCAANWDLMDPENKHRQKFEDAFWEVTPEQRKHYARFFELTRPQRPPKNRKCLRCRQPVSSEQKASQNDYRLCGVCRHHIMRFYGKLAEETA